MFPAPSLHCPACQGTQLWFPGLTHGYLPQLGTAGCTGMEGLAESQEAQVSLMPPVKTWPRVSPLLSWSVWSRLCSQPLLVQMSILAEHRENSGLSLQSAFSISYSIFSTLLAPPHHQGRGTKATPSLASEGARYNLRCAREIYKV